MKIKIINSTSIIMTIGLAFLPIFAASPGSLDSSFGVGGIMKAVIIENQLITDVAVSNRGEIVSVGFDLDQDDFLIMRHLANGNLDTNFGGDGIVTTDFAGGDDAALSAIFQNDGKTVVCGRFNGVNNSGIARYNNDGSLDTSFDLDGKRTINNVSCEALAIQSDGKIIGVGDSVGVDLVVFRLNLDGSIDTSFGVNGFASTSGATGDKTFLNVKIQQDGKIVALGKLPNSFSVIARYNTNGSLDTSFSGDGLFTIDIPGGNLFLDDFAIDPSTSKITAVGSASTPRELFVVRITRDGIVDLTFSGDGFVQINLNQGPTVKADVLIQTDGKMVISASSNAFNFPLFKLVLLRLNNNGNLDNTFGNQGIVTYGNLRSLSECELAFSGDKLVVATHEATPDRDFQISRHNLSSTPTQPGDFDGDAFTDSAVYRPTTGNWFILNSSTNTVTIDQFGANGDIPIDGDFDGDGRCDVAIYRPSNGTWFFKRSSDSTITGATFGGAGDRPIPGDYDKDGKTDMAFFRPGNGNWFVLRSSTNFSTFFAYPFGQAGDIPLTIGGL